MSPCLTVNRKNVTCVTGLLVSLHCTVTLHLLQLIVFGFYVFMTGEHSSTYRKGVHVYTYCIRHVLYRV